MSESAAGMTSPSPILPPAPRRWLRWLLIGSLAINALLIGVMLRSVWHLRANAQINGAGLEAGLPGFINGLPKDRRETLRRDGWRALRPLRAEARRVRAEAARLFAAEPFDPAAFAAAQAAVLDADIKWRRMSQQLLLETGQQMTGAERRAYLSWRTRGQRGGGAGSLRGERDPTSGEDRPTNGKNPKQE